MPEITKEVLKDFTNIAEWDGTKKAWIYREDRYSGGAMIYLMKSKGELITSLNSCRYINISINNKKYKLHRLAYCIYHNCTINEKTMIDHRNNIKHDNSIENLRLATLKQNSANASKWLRSTSSQFKGIYWSEHNKKWRAQIMLDENRKHLGYFPSEVEAAKAYNIAAIAAFGEYAKLNDIPAT